MAWLKKAPTALVISVVVMVGMGALALLGGFVLLELNERPTEDYRAFVNTLVNLLTFVMTGGATVAAVSAARSASNAEDNTNGALSAKSDEIADAAVNRADARNNGTGQ